MPLDETPGASLPPPPPPPPVAYAAGRNVGMLVLCYLWVFALIPFITEKNDAEVKWHARHGLVLLAAEIAVYMGLTFTSFILPFLVFLFPLFSLAVLILHVCEILKSVNGQRLLLPGLSEYADKL